MTTDYVTPQMVSSAVDFFSKASLPCHFQSKSHTVFAVVDNWVFLGLELPT